MFFSFGFVSNNWYGILHSCQAEWTKIWPKNAKMGPKTFYRKTMNEKNFVGIQLIGSSCLFYNHKTSVPVYSLFSDVGQAKSNKKEPTNCMSWCWAFKRKTRKHQRCCSLLPSLNAQHQHLQIVGSFMLLLLGCPTSENNLWITTRFGDFEANSCHTKAARTGLYSMKESSSYTMFLGLPKFETREGPTKIWN